MIKQTKKLSFTEVSVEIIPLGEDYQILVYGGDVPHIGCCVIAVPRPSLADNSKISCTSSIVNVVGHKDEVICRMLAEAYCKKKCTVVVCTGGFHINHISEAQINELIIAIEEIIRRICSD